MKRTKNVSRRTALIVAICIDLVFLSLSIFFSFLFVVFAINYSTYDIDYDDLTYKELAFDRYEKVNLGRTVGYAIYFKEYSEPFLIDSIRARELDSASLKNLTETEMLKVYFSKSSHRDYEYEIYEVSCNATTFLSLSDYANSERNNSFWGMLLSPVAALVCLYPVRLFTHDYRTHYKRNHN